MVWTPTKVTLNPRVIPENLLTYCTDATRQAEALTWASGTGLRLIKTVAALNANKSLPPYPSVEFSDDNDEQAYGDDLIPCVYSLTLNFGVQATTAAVALANARKYDAAFRSMIVNCPAATLGASTGGTVATAQVENIQTGFLVIKAGNQGKATSDFLQEFQIKVMVSIYGPANA